MNIFDLLSEYNSKKKYYTDKNEAMELFINQARAIHKIKKTEGFKEIRDYFTRIVVACNDRFRSMKSEKELAKTQGELELALSFLNFLDNILETDITKEDLDILNS